MPPTKLSSREFNQDTGRAKKAADLGPVFITDRGRPSHVLLSIADYEKLAHPHQTIVEILAMPEGADMDFEPPRLGRMSRPPDLG